MSARSFRIQVSVAPPVFGLPYRAVASEGSSLGERQRRLDGEAV
ncbi:hypothetical protein ABFA25_14510 [Mycobacterium lepromatosis]|nr:hypothetical protein [Mycobacterium lepromatosis]